MYDETMAGMEDYYGAYGGYYPGMMMPMMTSMAAY